MPELLGTASFPSGDLVLIDFGLLRMWSGDRVPVLAAPEEVAAVNDEGDFEIVGRDAVDVAARLDLAVVKGRYAFDMPSDGEPVRSKVARVCRETGLDATLRALPRMAHHTRVQRLLDESPGGAEVPYSGGWAVAVRGLPARRRLRVLGERMDPTGPDAGRWHSVWVELNGWNNDEARDGLADLAFWGRDAHAVADRVEPPAAFVLERPGVFGWTDLTDSELTARHRALHDLRSAEGLLFWFEARPHDDHYRVLERMYRSPTESGSIEVGGALLTGWFTSWGDGAFPVYRDLGPDGNLLRVRVELGAPEIVRLRRDLERRWFGDFSKLAIVSVRVARDGSPVGWLYREGPDNDRDSGWRVFAGDETRGYLDDPANCLTIPLRELIESDRVLEGLFDQPAPAAFERDTPDGAVTPAPRPEDH